MLEAGLLADFSWVF